MDENKITEEIRKTKMEAAQIFDANQLVMMSRLARHQVNRELKEMKNEDTIFEETEVEEINLVVKRWGEDGLIVKLNRIYKLDYLLFLKKSTVDPEEEENIEKILNTLE